MPASEIDDIFAGVVSAPTASVQKPVGKKRKKRKAEVAETGPPSSKITSSSSLATGKTKSKKVTKAKSSKAAAETVFDPSSVIESQVQAKKVKPASSKNKPSEEEADFMDTRGKSSECAIIALT